MLILLLLLLNVELQVLTDVLLLLQPRCRLVGLQNVKGPLLLMHLPANRGDPAELQLQLAQLQSEEDAHIKGT